MYRSQGISIVSCWTGSLPHVLYSYPPLIYESDGYFALHLDLYRTHGDFDAKTSSARLSHHLYGSPLHLGSQHPRRHACASGDDGALVSFHARCWWSCLQNDVDESDVDEAGGMGIASEWVSGWMNVRTGYEAQGN